MVRAIATGGCRVSDYTYFWALKRRLLSTCGLTMFVPCVQHAFLVCPRAKGTAAVIFSAKQTTPTICTCEPSAVMHTTKLWEDDSFSFLCFFLFVFSVHVGLAKCWAFGMWRGWLQELFGLEFPRVANDAIPLTLVTEPFTVESVEFVNRWYLL